MRTPQEQIDNFWDGFEESGDCWIWRRALYPSGYGLIRFRGACWPTHRLAWALAIGPIPFGLWVLHHCDNRPCGNPDHLFLGTNQDNVNDMVSKGRSRHDGHPGERHWAAKLNTQLVQQIRQLHDQGHTFQELSAQFGVGPTTVSRVTRKKLWACVA